MIGENIPERHEQARADLEASMAQFLANGEDPRLRYRRFGTAQPQLPVVPRPAGPGQAGGAGAAQHQLLGRAIQAAKTMTVDEAQLLTLSRKHSL